MVVRSMRDFLVRTVMRVVAMYSAHGQSVFSTNSTWKYFKGRFGSFHAGHDRMA